MGRGASDTVARARHPLTREMSGHGGARLPGVAEPIHPPSSHGGMVSEGRQPYRLRGRMGPPFRLLAERKKDGAITMRISQVSFRTSKWVEKERRRLLVTDVSESSGLKWGY